MGVRCAAIDCGEGDTGRGIVAICPAAALPDQAFPGSLATAGTHRPFTRVKYGEPASFGALASMLSCHVHVSTLRRLDGEQPLIATTTAAHGGAGPQITRCHAPSQRRRKLPVAPTRDVDTRTHTTLLPMRSQDSAHRRHASAHCCIIASPPPTVSHARAQVRQASAHTLHACAYIYEPRSMTSAEVWQIFAQSTRMFWCSTLACWPPSVRQCTAVAVHVA